MSSYPVEIRLRATGEFVPATLYDEMAAADLLVVDGEWRSERSIVMQELLAARVPRNKWPQSLHWDWVKKAPMLEELGTMCFGIVCDSQWQGVMLAKASSLHVARLAADKGKELLYVDFLEIAPWNWPIPEINRAGKYGAIGPVLFWKAVKLSEEEGFHGRVGLHALPQSEVFYTEVCKMTPIGRDASKQNLLYFELSRDEAQRILQGDRK